MLKVKLRDIYEGAKSISEFRKTKFYSKWVIPIEDALDLAEKKAMQADKVKIERAKELGKLSEDEKMYLFEGENADIFRKEMDELFDSEVEFSCDKFNISEICKEDTVISGEVVRDMKWLLAA